MIREAAALALLLAACGRGDGPARPAGLPAPGAAPPLAPSGHEGVVARTMPAGGLVHDFESDPNALGGAVGAYGDAAPDFSDGVGPDDSVYFNPGTIGYDPAHVRGGRQSFRIVWRSRPGGAGWASFGLDLGPVLDAAREPAVIETRDVSAFRALAFWIQGARGGERFAVTFRDSHAPDYLPQSRRVVLPGGLPDAEWRRIEIPLSDVAADGVDLGRLVHVGLDLTENIPGAGAGAVYVDDFSFVQ